MLCKVFCPLFDHAVWFSPEDDTLYHSNSVNICKTNTMDWKPDTLALQTNNIDNQIPSGGTEEANEKKNPSEIFIPLFNLLTDFKITWPEFEIEFYSVKGEQTISISKDGRLNNLQTLEKNINLEFFTQLSLVEV